MSQFVVKVFAILGLTWLNLVSFLLIPVNFYSVNTQLMSQLVVKVFAILGLTQLNLVYFLVNSSVIFTWLILGLHSLKSG